MLDVFTFYSRMASATFNMATTAFRLSETLSASQEVIAKRSSLLSAASQSPLTGDYAELGKMVPEKIDAFGKAGLAMAGDWWRFQSALMMEAQNFGASAMNGRLRTFEDWSALFERNANFGLKTLEKAASASARGLGPIHARATANAKRLRHRTDKKPGSTEL